MMAKPHLLFVNRAQFGYHIDSYKYCQYLSGNFHITYIGWDYSLPRILNNNLKIEFISRKGNKLLRYLLFLIKVNQAIKAYQPDLIFMDYFFGSSIVKILNRKKHFIVDIRTRSIGKNDFRNFLSDLALRIETCCFRNLTILSEGLAESLKLKKYHLLPLGGESFCRGKKTYDNFHLLYVGTLQGRNILDCVKGFHNFLNRLSNPMKQKFHFSIVGDSPGSELSIIRNYVKDENLGFFFTLAGFVHNDKLHDFFEDANLGISYIPMTKYFDNQPPTKTYEYLLSGLPVITTKTKENVKILRLDCGEFIDDNPDSFFLGLSNFVQRCNYLSADEIRTCYKDFLWVNIVENNLMPYLLKLIRENHS